MSKKRITVSGSGHNLYKVSNSSGWHYVYKVEVKLPFNNEISVGKSRTFDDALSLIKSYSGRSIVKIENW